MAGARAWWFLTCLSAFQKTGLPAHTFDNTFCGSCGDNVGIRRYEMYEDPVGSRKYAPQVSWLTEWPKSRAQNPIVSLLKLRLPGFPVVLGWTGRLVPVGLETKNLKGPLLGRLGWPSET